MICRIAAQGCAKEDDDDPGNQQFGWLEDQLAVFRSRQMQVRMPVSIRTLNQSDVHCTQVWMMGAFSGLCGELCAYSVPRPCTTKG